MNNISNATSSNQNTLSKFSQVQSNAPQVDQTGASQALSSSNQNDSQFKQSSISQPKPSVNVEISKNAQEKSQGLGAFPALNGQENTTGLKRSESLVNSKNNDIATRRASQEEKQVEQQPSTQERAIDRETEEKIKQAEFDIRQEEKRELLEKSDEQSRMSENRLENTRAAETQTAETQTLAAQNNRSEFIENIKIESAQAQKDQAIREQLFQKRAEVVEALRAIAERTAAVRAEVEEVSPVKIEQPDLPTQSQAPSSVLQNELDTALAAANAQESTNPAFASEATSEATSAEADFNKNQSIAESGKDQAEATNARSEKVFDAAVKGQQVQQILTGQTSLYSRIEAEIDRKQRNAEPGNLVSTLV